MKVWSKEWTEACKEKSLKDREYLKRTKGWTGKYFWVATGCPDGTDKSKEFHSDNGKIVFMKYEEKPTPSDLATRPFDGTKYFVRAIDPYDMWVHVLSKRKTVMWAISSGKFRFDGKAQEMIDRLPEFASYVDLASSIPVEEY